MLPGGSNLRLPASRGTTATTLEVCGAPPPDCWSGGPCAGVPDMCVRPLAGVGDGA
jgi:hypothetical protein